MKSLLLSLLLVATSTFASPADETNKEFHVPIVSAVDPTKLPDKGTKGDQVLLFGTDQQQGVRIGIDMSSFHWDKSHNRIEFIEIVFMKKDGNDIEIDTAMAIDCWGHKVWQAKHVATDIKTQKQLAKVETGEGWKPIEAESVSDFEAKSFCPRVKDPRATEI